MITKVVTVAVLWATILLTGFVLIGDLRTSFGTLESLQFRSLLIVIAILVSVHVLSLPTARKRG